MRSSRKIRSTRTRSVCVSCVSRWMETDMFMAAITQAGASALCILRQDHTLRYKYSCGGHAVIHAEWLTAQDFTEKGNRLSRTSGRGLENNFISGAVTLYTNLIFRWVDGGHMDSEEKYYSWSVEEPAAEMKSTPWLKADWFKLHIINLLLWRKRRHDPA